MAASDETWKFWHNFVFTDGLFYVQLYVAIRCRDWDLRVSALKQMAPTFKAYDRTCYQKLVPNHLADLVSFPPLILEGLKKGFTISINGDKGHSVAIDEAHEMCINKDLKMAIAHPTQAYLQKTSLFLRYRITAHKNLLDQLFPCSVSSPPPVKVFDSTPEMKKVEENITTMKMAYFQHQKQAIVGF